MGRPRPGEGLRTQWDLTQVAQFTSDVDEYEYTAALDEATSRPRARRACIQARARRRPSRRRPTRSSIRRRAEDRRYLVPMHQPPCGLIPLLLDVRAAEPILAATRVDC